jgi:ubiquinone/menaquinone biosynthesis C-methylase UbiE
VNFDRVARPYRLLETLVFGRGLQEARCAFVRQIPNSKCALVVGEGDGRFLEELLRVRPELEVTCVEASPRMIALARPRVKEASVQFIEGDIRAVELPARLYDLIVTHFVLDCFSETSLPAVIDKLSAAAADDATWLVSDFQQTPRLWSQWLISVMYLFFRISAGIEARRLVDYVPFLRAKRFRLTNEQTYANGVIRSQLWQRL